MIKVKEDMTGWVMAEHGVPDSRLTVIKQAEDCINANGTRSAMWLCECSCAEHNKVIVRGAYIRNGRTRSCGCINSERTIAFNKETKSKTNVYSDKLTDQYGDYYIGWTTNTNKEFYFDADDFDVIKKYCWTEHITNYGYHALEARQPDSGQTIRMHYLVIGKNFDHIDRNPFNNRKYNLREPGNCGNAQNHSLRKDNTSGVSGINFDKRNGLYVSRIQADNKRIFLGYFENKNDAIIARLNAEIKYYGEFAPQRHLFEQYGITIQNELEEELNELQVV